MEQMAGLGLYYNHETSLSNNSNVILIRLYNFIAFLVFSTTDGANLNVTVGSDTRQNNASAVGTHLGYISFSAI